MGKSLDQLLSEGFQPATVRTTITVSNENGVVGYAVGGLSYQPAQSLGGGPFGGIGLNPARLIGMELKFTFSDRTIPIDPPGAFGHLPDSLQPFSIKHQDKLGVSFSRPAFLIAGDAPYRAKFTLLSWDSVSYNVAMEAKGNLLVGIGPGNAVYVVSFGEWAPGPH